MFKLFKKAAHVKDPKAKQNSFSGYYYNSNANENVTLSSYIGRDCFPDT